jgi:hypothetical protein
MWQKIIPTESTYGEDKNNVPKIYFANAIFIKWPLGDYIKGHRVHGGNEAYFFGYILWLLKFQIHQYLAMCTICLQKNLTINLS